MDHLTTDSELTKRLLGHVREGHPAAMDELFARYRAFLRQVIELRLDPKLRQRLDASDVVQEAQIEASRRMPAYLEDPPIPFRLWLRQIAFDRLIMMRRRHVEAGRRALGRELPLPDESSAQLGQRLLARGSAPSQQLARRELGGQVRRAIARLGDDDREILLMRNFEGLSNQEVARVFSIEPGTASKRYGRALLKLRELLLDEGFTEKPE
ncbi:MAG: sigma-70 family RNA polymerase sigma factor [Phycisphaerae bacterium]|nr:sigma-70 family RNA polymerase sigma factor [Phycisphaerae bacterium]